MLRPNGNHTQCHHPTLNPLHWWSILLHSAGCCSLPTGHSSFLVPHAEPRTEHASFVETACAEITAPFEAFSAAESPFLERAEHAARHRAVVEGSRLQWLRHEVRLAEEVRLEGVQLDGIPAGGVRLVGVQLDGVRLVDERFAAY